jgi:hypothetical protein
MSRFAQLIIRLARFIAGEAAPMARVRVFFDARLRILFPSLQPRRHPPSLRCPKFVSSRAQPRDPGSFSTQKYFDLT